MQYKQEAGIVPLDSKFPPFETLLKSFVDPAKTTTQDKFIENLGPLNGRITSTKTWSTIGTTGAYWTVYNGYLATTTAGNSRALIPHATSGKIHIAVDWRSGFAGLIIRGLDQNNYIQISIALANNGLRVEKVVAGVNTLLGTKGLTMTVGKIFQLGVEYDANTIKVYVDNELSLELNETALNTNLNVGIVSSTPDNKIKDWTGR
ncbi:hypothetical protein [Acinetobacter sp. TSRC1-2]|uniref:hypothetical protein n=1 Tax=unclassified Acinetobacter TaxID=196816 RepID=UPI003CF74C6B